MYVLLRFCFLLFTPFIADKELYRWIVGLERRLLLLCLIAMICALPLQIFLYLVLLSVEFEGNPRINCS
jgi:hypothetical protein